MTPDLHQTVSRVVGARRILVLGSSGSGKSHLTKRLCGLLDLEAIHLDALFWQPGWEPTPQGQWRDRVATLVRQEAWVMDGTYERSLDLRLPAAEAIIYVEDSRYRCLWRALRRALWPAEPHPSESPLGQRIDFGLARYIWRFPRRTRPQVLALVRQQGREGDLIRLHGPQDIERFLAGVATAKAG